MGLKSSVAGKGIVGLPIRPTKESSVLGLLSLYTPFGEGPLVPIGTEWDKSPIRIKRVQSQGTEVTPVLPIPAKDGKP